LGAAQTGISVRYRSAGVLCQSQVILEAAIKFPMAQAQPSASVPSETVGTPEALLETILNLASAAIGTEHGWLYEFDAGGEVLICKAARGAFRFDLGQRRNRGEGM
jgi:hypothetical protein